MCASIKGITILVTDIFIQSPNSKIIKPLSFQNENFSESRACRDRKVGYFHTASLATAEE